MIQQHPRLSAKEQNDIAAADTKIRTGTSRRQEIRSQVKDTQAPALKARNELLVSYCELVSGKVLEHGDLYIKMQDNLWQVTVVFECKEKNTTQEVNITVDPLTCDLVCASKMTTSQYADPKVHNHTSKIKIKPPSPCIHDED